MLQLFRTVPTKAEISQAATSTREIQCKQRHQVLNLLPKKKKKSKLKFLFPIHTSFSLRLKTKIEDAHRLSADTQVVCHLWKETVRVTAAKASSCFTRSFGSFEPWPKGRLQQSAGSWVSGAFSLTAETVNRSALLWCRRLRSGLTITSHGLRDGRGQHSGTLTWERSGLGQGTECYFQFPPQPNSPFYGSELSWSSAL